MDQNEPFKIGLFNPDGDANAAPQNGNHPRKRLIEGLLSSEDRAELAMVLQKIAQHQCKRRINARAAGNILENALGYIAANDDFPWAELNAGKRPAADLVGEFLWKQAMQDEDFISIIMPGFDRPPAGGRSA